MVNNKTKKRKIKGSGGKMSKIKTPEKEKTPTKTRKKVTFKTKGNNINPEIWGESPEEIEECYNKYSKKDNRDRYEAYRDEATELGITKKNINNYVNMKLCQKKEGKKRNKKILGNLKIKANRDYERLNQERILQEFIAQVRK
tara:strand:- start:5787 stop:6215 length:429 start_codon:yes stop_codon:yes gene_type:complete